MPHLTCIGQSREELEEILRDYRDMGVENILALRGDPPKDMPSLSEDGYCYAKDLVELAASFNAFSIGVAVYPEGHIEAPSLEEDVLYARQKIDAGADFAITQMFFDNRYYYRFMELAGRAGIYVPVIPGIMPVTDFSKIKRFSQMCGTSLPEQFVEGMEKATTPEDAWKTGIDYATRQVEDLWANGVRYFHFYTLNRSQAVTEILRNLHLETKPSLAGATR